MVLVGYKRLSSGLCEQLALSFWGLRTWRTPLGHGLGERFRWVRKTDSCILVIDGVLLVRLP